MINLGYKTTTGYNYREITENQFFMLFHVKHIEFWFVYLIMKLNFKNKMFMLNFFGELMSIISIGLTLILVFGDSDFCVNYHDEICFAYLIFGFIAIIILIIYEINN